MRTLEILKEMSHHLADFGELVIAGGAVRDELMNRPPKDFDLFILWQKDWEFDRIKEEITNRLGGFTRNKPVVTWHNSEPFLVADIKLGDSDVQILSNPAKTPEQLIETFDWNVCLFARTQERLIQRTAIEDISEGKELRLQKVTFPISTLRRGFRFSERFKMKLLNKDIVGLCEKIVSNHAAKNDIGPQGNEPDMPSLEANLLLD